MKATLILLFFVSYGTIEAGDNPALAYIEKYKSIAISEMERTGIPASIKLAQGLLESGSGSSTLALEANNHFGIKCGGAWSGATFYREDDDHDDKGNLIKSCFRKFDNPSQSFYAHSAFLTDQGRYEFLFNLPQGDYEGWAYGLKKAGYATDKAYPSKLISLIHKYELYQFDTTQDEPILATVPEAVSIEEESQGSDIVEYKPTTSSDLLEGERQRKELPVDQNYHRVQKGQTILEIAMIYDLNETKIRLRNRIPKDAEPLDGERIYLKKKISILQRPAFTRAPIEGTAAVDEEYIF